MSDFFDAIADDHSAFIAKQPLFFVATAAGASVSASAHPVIPSSVATRTSNCQSPLSLASSPPARA